MLVKVKHPETKKHVFSILVDFLKLVSKTLMNGAYASLLDIYLDDIFRSAKGNENVHATIVDQASRIVAERVKELKDPQASLDKKKQLVGVQSFVKSSSTILADMMRCFSYIVRFAIASTEIASTKDAKGKFKESLQHLMASAGAGAEASACFLAR